MPEVYRRAASILLLRPMQDGHRFLLLHKPRKGDSWQLPQGGIEEGEDVTQAALRELQEEAGIAGTSVLGTSPEVYQYDFPAGYRRFRPDNVRGQRIAFVYAVAGENAQVIVDGKEVDDHAWIDLPQLPKYVKRKRYAELVRKLFEEAVKLLPA